ncbi:MULTISPECIES: hypothetical protein [unclassified Crossiella]|uniref:hypothetical protein n=1 Tax=unclassified Crossiella TaxID=2620835 RepID=UPI001FFE3E7E|nr:MULTISPECIES: hypothetical protein [unclassified Crossiella]MCK2244361.1 hypothetical protein [Crossiella sp. S99.2]MCK2257811.1 hypothetical protein [Crossiella sp. S99.1]
MRVLVITGAPGVGKTHVAQRLVSCYRVPVAVLDCDPFVHPWESGEPLYRLMAAELGARIPAYREWGARVIVVHGVILAGGRTYEPVLEVLCALGTTPVVYGLCAGPDALADRIRQDHAAPHLVTGRLALTHLDQDVPEVPGVRLIETTHRDEQAVVTEIARQELADLGPGWLVG